MIIKFYLSKKLNTEKAFIKIWLYSAVNILVLNVILCVSILI